jgi:hypothetical protein
MLRPRLSQHGLAEIVFLGCWLSLAAPWLIGGSTIPYDAKAHFQAQIQFLANALHSGQSPFWSPHVFLGVPQIADPQSLIFSPAYLLAYFEKVPSFRMLDAYVLVLLALAGLAIMRLFRDRGWHPAGAVLAGIAIAFGCSAAWRIQHIGQIQSYAFFCIGLWLLDRAMCRRSMAWGGAAGLAMGVMLAEPNQVTLLGAYLLAGAVIATVLSDAQPRVSLRHLIAPLAVAATVTLLIAGLPLLFTALYLVSSNRPAIPLEEAARGSLHPISMLTIIVGDLFGALDPRVDYWGPYSMAWNPRELTLSQNMSQLYLGALPVLLVLTIGLSRGLLWTREIRFFTISAALMLLYALGSFTPAFEVFHRLVPGVAFFRRPADATFLFGAMVSIVGGYLAHRWLSRGLPNAGSGWTVGKLIVLLGALATAGLVAMLAGKFTVAQKPILLAIAWLLASVIVFRSIRHRALGRPALAIVATGLLMSADLAANNGPNESTAGSTEAYDVLDPRTRNETIRFLKDRVRRNTGSPWRDRVELVGLGFEWPNCAMVHGIEHTLGYNPLRIDTVSTAIGARDHIAGPDQRAFSPLFPSYRSRMASLLGLRYIASSVPIEQVDQNLPRGALRLIARTKEAYIYENADVLPRVIFARRAMPADFRKLLADGHWPDFDPIDTVLLDSSDSELWNIPDLTGAPENSASTATIMRYENTVVDVETVSPVAGFLVLNDVWHRWWTASVGDVPVPVLKANAMFRAVHVPAGRHRVRFEFQPLAGAIAELRRKSLHRR